MLKKIKIFEFNKHAGLSYETKTIYLPYQRIFEERKIK